MTLRRNGNLIIGGKWFNVDAPIVNWHENGWDATSLRCIPTKTEKLPACLSDPRVPGDIPYSLPKGLAYSNRFSTRAPLRTKAFDGGLHPTYEAAKAVIKKFVIHFDGCATSDMCFNVLQNERGLSVHFLLDNDGTIYQTLDLALMGFHAAEFNNDSIGVELCSRGDARADRGFYDRQHLPKGQQRSPRPCRINNHPILGWDYTSDQYEAMDRLAKVLLRLLPNIAADYPQSSPGVQSWDTLPPASVFGFSGYLGHYHCTDNKWDPGPWDFKAFVRKMRGAFCFPVFPRGAPEKDQDKPLIPADTGELHAGRDALYALNESKADGGYYPVGPWGESRIWHGGVHLAGADGAEVFAPFAGRLVAMRMGAGGTSIGSTNFILLRHQMSLGARKVEFYSLYMHLAEDPAWRTKLGDRLKPGDVSLLDEPIEAGTPIGRMGKAGPEGLSRTQVHFEIFSTTDLFDGYPASPWLLVDGTGGGRFSEADDISGSIDTNKDGILTRAEVNAFYQSGGGGAFRFHVVRHVSEWTHDPPWSDALKQPKDWKAMRPDAIDHLVAEQIAPTLWWTDKVAAHCRLPSDGVVYHYHPVNFVSWFNQMLAEAAKREEGAPALTDADTREIPPGITGDKEGTSMLSTDEFLDDPCNTKLTLKELVQGYDAPECGP